MHLSQLILFEFACLHNLTTFAKCFRLLKYFCLFAEERDRRNIEEVLKCCASVFSVSPSIQIAIKMQTVQEYSAVSARLESVDKNSEIVGASSNPLSEIKKLRTAVTHPRETTECRVPKVTTDRRDQTPLSANQSEKHFHASIVDEKYLLLDQVEGSSLYRCVNINTQDELVCKVKCFSL